MNVVVYCGSNPGNNPEYEQATTKLGEWIGSSGNNLVYGGSSVGLMGVISRSVMENGGKAYGVEPRFFIEARVEQQDLTELYVVETMSERKAKMIELGDVFVALPGGVGTLEEISEIMSRIRLHLTCGPCFCLNIDGFYDPLEDLVERMYKLGFMESWDRQAFLFPKTVEELIEHLRVWQPETGFDGRPLIPEESAALHYG
jgi:hypothetical protein